jgi:hypothetical protein
VNARIGSVSPQLLQPQGFSPRKKKNKKTKKMEGRAGGGAAPRTAMDYTLAALKLFGSQLARSTTAPSSEGSSPAQMLFDIRFQRAWIQVPVSFFPASLSPPLLPCPAP